MVGAAIRQVFAAPTREQARAILTDVVARLEQRRAEGRGAARRRRGRPARVSRLPGRAPLQAALDEPTRARQPRDRTPLRRRRDLPQRRRPDPPRQLTAGRTKRRMARHETLPLPRVDRRACTRPRSTLRATSPTPPSSRCRRARGGNAHPGLSRQRPTRRSDLHHNTGRVRGLRRDVPIALDMSRSTTRQFDWRLSGEAVSRLVASTLEVVWRSPLRPDAEHAETPAGPGDSTEGHNEGPARMRRGMRRARRCVAREALAATSWCGAREC